MLALLLHRAPPSALVRTITAFTVAHSITLAVATLGYVQVPPPPVDAVIALSILFVGPDRPSAGAGRGVTDRPSVGRRIHFRLAARLRLRGRARGGGLPQDDIPFALLLFNVGVEIGQLAFVAL